MNAVLQFDLSGDGGGQWVAAIAEVSSHRLGPAHPNLTST
jgi:hypothetical protein